MMEYAPGGELFVRIAECGSYTEMEAKPIFAQIASAVQYMVKTFYSKILNFVSNNYIHVCKFVSGSKLLLVKSNQMYLERKMFHLYFT